MARISFMKGVEAGAKSQSGARHLRRKEEKLKGLSIPAMKKLIRRNEQRKP